jgi:hypothetical protein
MTYKYNFENFFDFFRLYETSENSYKKKRFFLHKTVGIDFESDAIFSNTVFCTFWTLKRELGRTVRKLGPRRVDTKPMTLKMINIIKNPRQRRQFDPLSHAGQNECFSKT